MKRIAAFTLSLLASSLLVSAAGKIFPYAYNQEDLPNGLRLITVPTDYPNIVSVFIVVSTGSRNEVEPGKSGFAHLFEHLMFRGTPEFSSERYQMELRNAGAYSNAFTTDDFTAYHTTFSKEDLPRVLTMEADRFQHLSYEEPGFRTEALAVLGEYNKNSANPGSKLNEALRATAFATHTYKHTTMGFIEDIKAMPDEFDYSRQFFDRYYRPENTTIIVAGDLDAKKVRAQVGESWGAWKRGNFKPQIPAEPAQNGARTAHVDWPAPTLPWVVVAWRGPAYTDDAMDSVALDAVARLGFSQNSPIFQKLVIAEQKADALFGGQPASRDPQLFSVRSRVKKESDLAGIEQQIIAEAQAFATRPVDPKQLETLKQRMRYEFALGLDNSEAIAQTVARYVALRRTPETINRYFDLFDKLTPEDIRKVAAKYLVEKNRTAVTLTGKAGASK
jgi:zinc protease